MSALQQLWTPQARRGLVLLDNPRKVRRSRGTPSLLNGLLAYYPLGEASGNRADSTGGGALVPVAAPGNMAGKVGNAAAFVQASSQALRRSDSVGVVPVVTGYWAGGWARFATGQTGNPVCFGVQPSGGATPRTLWIFWAVATGRFTAAGLAADGTTLFTMAHSLTGLALDTWHRADFWHSPGTSELKFRVNGTTDTLSWPSNNLYAVTTQRITLGMRAEDVGGNALNGGLDEWGVWNRPPTTTELAAVLAGNTYPF